METDRIDERKLEPAAREQLRRTVARLHKREQKQTGIAKVLSLRRSTVTEWVNMAQSGQSLKEKKRGRREGIGRRLTSDQEVFPQRSIEDKTPDQMKLPFALWNTRAVRELIKSLYGVDLPVRSMRNYLHRWGFTPQRRLKRALEQKPKAVRKWLREECPGIAARAQSEGAEIHWGNETAVSSAEHSPRGYAPNDKTPVLISSRAQQ